MDVLSEIASNAELATVGTGVLLVLREALIWLLAVWAMRTEKDKKEELALMLLCLLAPRRAEKVRERMAAVRAQLARPTKPRHKLIK